MKRSAEKHLPFQINGFDRMILINLNFITPVNRNPIIVQQSSGMIKLLSILTIFMTVANASVAQIVEKKKRFKHHTVANPLPGPEGLGTGAFTLADFDNDGDLDITISANGKDGPVFLFENKGEYWENYTIGIGDEMQLGAVSTDIDRDGYIDLVMGRFWFRNPGNVNRAGNVMWEKIFYNGGLDAENHDIASADLNLDGLNDIVSYSQYMGKGILRWYNVQNPRDWTYHTIADDVNDLVKDVKGSNGIHGGFAPKGIGDLDGDKFPDLVMPTGFYRNPGKKSEAKWTFVRWQFETGVIPNPYGLSCRSWITDLDMDGDNDVVYTDCDGANSKGYYIENIKQKTFRKTELPSLPDSTGSFHSLAVADFDLDGDLDIFSGEQEDPDPGMKPVGLKERGFIWLNTGSIREPKFQLTIFHIDNPGWHETQSGDIDGDGDIDLATKIWNKDGDTYHLDFWENLSKQ
jgi:hypothetical protein